MNIELQTICTKNAIKLKFYGQYYLQFLDIKNRKKQTLTRESDIAIIHGSEEIL